MILFVFVCAVVADATSNTDAAVATVPDFSH